jgi:PPK2 family polyphosphate:nucleotide phosphotransferase
MKLNSKKFRIKHKSNLRLSKLKTVSSMLYQGDEDYKKKLALFQDELKSLQEKLYASSNYAFLIIFQGMDTSGKDGAISHVMSGVNPQAVNVSSFKQPTLEELRHDFLWRTVAKLPERGQIGIFNRSYYEDVLVPRVHKDVLKSSRIPSQLMKQKGFWRDRLDDITAHEDYLQRQGTHIVKIFLHISKDEQARRLKARFDDPDKMWKISEGDVEERQFWKEYQDAYESCLSHTSTKESAWYVVPADDKRNARLIISRIILDEFRELNVQYPKMDEQALRKLQKLKKEL